MTNEVPNLLTATVEQGPKRMATMQAKVRTQ